MPRLRHSDLDRIVALLDSRLFALKERLGENPPFSKTKILNVLDRLELDVEVIRMLSPHAHDEVLSSDIQDALNEAIAYQEDWT